MVEKQAGIEIFVEIHPKPPPVFANGEVAALFAGFLVLLQAFLALAAFEVDLCGRKAGYEGNGFEHFGEPCFVCFGLHQPAGVVFLQMDLVAVNIDGKRKLRNIAVIHTPRFDAVAPRPFQVVFDVFAQTVGKRGDVGHKFQCFQTALLRRTGVFYRKARVRTV